MSGCGRRFWRRLGLSTPRDVFLLEEMIEAADRAVALVEGLTVEDVTADRMRRDALLWNFALLGEAVTQLSQELKDRFPEVPWRQPARLRNRIIHGYWSIDLDVVHTTAGKQLPGFVAELRRVRALIVDEPHSGGTAPAATPVEPPA
jgi:uncharacterized protein with HEPN domain